MNFTCRFQHSNGFNFGLGSLKMNTKHHTPECFVENSKVFFRIGTVKRRQKVGIVSGSITLRLHCRRRLNNISPFISSENVRDVRLQCQMDDESMFLDNHKKNVEFSDSHLSGGLVKPGKGSVEASNNDLSSLSIVNDSVEEESNNPQLEELRDSLQKAVRELEVAQLNSTIFEEKAQRISELAIQQKDEAENAWVNVTSTLSTIQEIINEETDLKDALQKATMALSMADARIEVATAALHTTEESSGTAEDLTNEQQLALLEAQEEFKSCEICLSNFETQLSEIHIKKIELQEEVDRLSVAAEKAQFDIIKTEEEVANIMSLAEKAVALELEATQHVNDAEIALQKAEKFLSAVDNAGSQGLISQEQLNEEETATLDEVSENEIVDVNTKSDAYELPHDGLSDSDLSVHNVDELGLHDEMSDKDNDKLISDSNKETEVVGEKPKTPVQVKKQETQKDPIKENATPQSASKSLLNKSSRFFPASFFSFDVDNEDFTPTHVFQEFLATAKKQAPKLILGILFLGIG